MAEPDNSQGSTRLDPKGSVISDCLRELQGIIAEIDQTRASEIVMGVGYTGVRLSSGQVGMAHSLLNEGTSGSAHMSGKAGHLAGSSALELARLALSWDIKARVVGIATLNALSQIALDKLAREICPHGGDVVDHLTIEGKIVAVVGNMQPMVVKLRDTAKQVHVLERSLELRDGSTLPDTAAEQILPESDIVLITGTALENGTIDRLLELSKNAEEVAIVGPTAGMLPTVLFKHGATIVGTVRVTNPDKAMQIIGEGGMPRALMEATDRRVYRPALA